MTAAPRLETISLNIPGKPLAFARTRGENRFTPSPQRAYASLIGLLANQAMARAGLDPLDGPLEMQMRATYAYPDSWSEAKRTREVFKTSKPDADNIVKIVADALSTIVYRDDAQIVRVNAEKCYGEIEGVTVVISQIEQERVLA